jgi:hypothetical protein
MKGGQTLKEAVKRMTITLFTNTTCRFLNWTGSSRKENDSDDNIEHSDKDDSTKKIAFKDLQCRKVLESEYFYL